MEPTVSNEPQAQQCTPDAITQTLRTVVQQLATELHPHKHNALTVTLDSALERDLGFDSLGRMELLLRLERAFGVQLPEQVLATARSRLAAVLDARPELRTIDGMAGPLAELEAIEQRLAFRRQVFNQASHQYNEAVGQFPTRLLTPFFRFGAAGRL